MCQETSNNLSAPARSRKKHRQPCSAFYSSLEPIPEGLSKESFTEEFFPYTTSGLPFQSEALSIVNHQRAQRNLPPFQGSPELFHRAALHCQDMAQRAAVFHSVRTIEELVEHLGAPNAAENVQRGESVSHLHSASFSQIGSVNYNNIFSTVFTEFGAAYILGVDGRVYLCQVFRDTVTVEHNRALMSSPTGHDERDLL